MPGIYEINNDGEFYLSKYLLSNWNSISNASEGIGIIQEFEVMVSDGLLSDSGVFSIYIPADYSPPEIRLSNGTPQIISSDTGTIDENANVDTVIYRAEATDNDGDNITFSISGTDADYVTIVPEGPNDGEVKLLQSADYENKASYTFDITASDYYANTILGGSNTKNITVYVTDVNEALFSMDLTQQL